MLKSGWTTDALCATAIGLVLLLVYFTAADSPCAGIKKTDTSACIDATYEKIVKRRTGW